jgi:Domain of unknown function (DUF5916)
MRSALVAALLARAALAATPEPGDAAIAARAAGPIRVDGRLDEPDWANAPAWSAFVQVFPRAGAPPSERTEVRFLYDDGTIYVGITCHDRRPEEIARPLARRDDLPPGDGVRVALDSLHDHRTGYSFAISAGGVLEDRLLFNDDEDSKDWDAVWLGATSTSGDGWTAELAIPLAELRLRGSGPRTFGVYVERTIGRTHEVIGSVLIRSSSGGFVSRFGHLELGAVDPPLGVELTPYLAARAVMRPQFSDPARPMPRIVDPSADLGLDVRAPLGPGLTLTGAVNPDFGQVEADPVILNLTRFEPFFPEKRPFFLKDLDLFEPLRGGDAPHQILYTRRVGLSAPILGAAKISGEAAPGWQLGVLDALVVGASAPRDEANPDRRVEFHAEQPLRVAPNSALPAEPPAPRNFLAATLRRALGGSSSARLSAALATPLGPACTPEDEDAVPQPARCQPGGNAAAADVDLRSRSGDYGFAGQVAVSQSVGGPSERVLPDGTRLARGDAGVGTYGIVGKTSGEPLQADLLWEYAAPRFDVNATGFQPDQNVAALSPSLRFVRASEGIGGLRSFSARLSGRTAWSSDGRGLLREARASLDATAVTGGYHEVSCGGDVSGWTWDLREIVGSGLAYLRPASASASCTATTNRNRPVSLQVEANASRFFPAGLVEGAGVWGGGGQAVAFLRPARRFETRLGAQVTQKIVPGRFIDEAEDGSFLFGDLLSRSVTLKLRQEIVATRALSFQLYAELFAALGRFQAYYTAPPPSSDRLHLRSLRPVPAPSDPHDFRLASLRVNAVVRWEYRPGSTLFLVYARQQDGERSLDARTRIDLGLDPLSSAPATDVFLVKVSFWSVR